MRYTKQILEAALVGATSYSDMARNLGKSPRGSVVTQISKRCKYFCVDTSTLLGQAHLRGRPAKNLKGPDNVLQLGTPSDLRKSGRTLTRCLLAIGRKYICAECSTEPMWQGKPLTIQVDHIDGCYWNNQENNLRFLCPNCHSQTPTFGNKPR